MAETNDHYWSLIRAKDYGLFDKNCKLIALEDIKYS
jgi:hypothetical protein